MSVFHSYLISNVPPIAGTFDLAQGVQVTGLPDGLGTLKQSTSAISLLFKKTRPEDQVTTVRLSVARMGSIGLEISLSPVGHEQFYESIEAALAMKMLLMTCGFGNAEAVVALSVPIAELASAEDQSVYVTDIDLSKGGLRYLFGDDAPDEVMQRTRDLWPNFVGLFYGQERDRFRLALQAVEASRYSYDPRFALAALWVAPEALFAKDPSEATFKLTAAWAAFSHESGEERLALQKRLHKLYGFRCKSVHGRSLDPKEFESAYGETYVRLMNCLWNIVSSGELPPAGELQNRIFL